jgi:hypothetical protein
LVKTDAFTYPSYPNKSAVASGQLGGNAFVDSGSASVSAPNDVVDAYSKLFNPPAISPPELGFYAIECDAQAPEEPFSVIINGTDFVIPGSSFVLSDAILSENGFSGPYGNYCFSGLQDGGIFGGARYVFLHNMGMAYIRS